MRSGASSEATSWKLPPQYTKPNSYRLHQGRGVFISDWIYFRWFIRVKGKNNTEVRAEC